MQIDSDADAAIARIAPGARVYVAGKSGTPLALLNALARRGTPDIELYLYLPDGLDLVAFAKAAPMLKLRPLYVGVPIPQSDRPESLGYLPLSLPAVEAMVVNRMLSFDAAIVATSPADANGEVNLGPAVGITRAVLERVPLAIAEIVPSMPRVAGDACWSLNRFTAAVMLERPLVDYAHERDDARAERIARYVARLVEDGATLQIGPGRVPNGAMRFLRGRRDLRILTDFLSEEVADLVESGAVRGDVGLRDTDPAVMASIATGGHRLFARLDANPRYTFWPIETVTDPARLSRRELFASLTQAFVVDLTGQASCERSSPELFGGLGSQPEFMRAAGRVPGGKPIVCLYATDASGASNIRSALGSDQPISLLRTDVHFVVTEWGIAVLHGRTIEERALALIEVAHPDHRARLLAEGCASRLVGARIRATNRDAYETAEERELTLGSGAKVLIRPARLVDVPALQRLFHHVSKDEAYLRFFRYLDALSIEEAVRLCASEQPLDAMYVATVGDRRGERIIAAAQLFGEPTTGLGEVGYLVDHDWQGMGLGRRLQGVLIDRAKAMGLRGLRAEILADNQRMLALARSANLAVRAERDGDTVELVMTWTCAASIPTRSP